MGCSFPPCGRNCWTLAETANQNAPDGLQRLLSKSKWDAEALRAQFEAEIYATLADTTTYWDLDETGFLKAGSHSIGVQRQYTGTAGKSANCQIAVFLAFSSSKGYALTDFRFFLPTSWAKDRKRCQAAGIPDDVVHQTKGKLAVDLLSKALAKGYEADWTTGDCVYGDSPDLRRFLVENQRGFVFAMHTDRLCQPISSPEAILIENAPSEVKVWQRCHILGSQGPLAYEWGALEVTYQDLRCTLVFRRRGKEVTAYLAWAPRAFELREVAQAICRRWDVERCFEEAKQEVGLDEFQARKWQSVHRHVILAMQAFWLLVQVKRRCRTSLPLARRYLRIPWQARPLEAAQLLLWTRFREWHTLKTTRSKWRSRLKLDSHEAPG